MEVQRTKEGPLGDHAPKAGTLPRTPYENKVMYGVDKETEGLEKSDDLLEMIIMFVQMDLVDG